MSNLHNQLRFVKAYNKKEQDAYFAKTGIIVDIQNIGRNTAPIALKTHKSVKEIYKGVWIATDTIEFSDGNFTNVYDLSWDSKNTKLAPVIHSERKPYYMLDFFKKDPSLLAVMNGAYYFLVDIGKEYPKEYNFHFSVREGKVVGLPSSDEPIVFTKKQANTLFAKEVKARGTIRIGKHIIKWVGAQSSMRKQNTRKAVLYNSGSAKIVKSYDPKTGVRMGVIDEGNVYTPKDENAVDLIIDEQKGKLVIKRMHKRGGTHYFSGLFVLQIKEGISFRVGETVTPVLLDGLQLKTITSSITVGKSVHDSFFKAPQRVNSRDARSLIAKDKKGNIHFIVFDGCKYIPNFRGVGAKDIQNFFSKSRYQWAYLLDGGSSSRIVTRNEKKINFFANEFAFKKVTNEIFMWDSKRHRKLASTFALKIQTQ